MKSTLKEIVVKWLFPGSSVKMFPGSWQSALPRLLFLLDPFDDEKVEQICFFFAELFRCSLIDSFLNFSFVMGL